MVNITKASSSLSISTSNCAVVQYALRLKNMFILYGSMRFRDQYQTANSSFFCGSIYSKASRETQKER